MVPIEPLFLIFTPKYCLLPLNLGWPVSQHAVEVTLHDSQRQGIRSLAEVSLVAQWLRIHLPVQGTRVRALVLEDATCRGATKPVHHNY